MRAATQALCAYEDLGAIAIKGLVRPERAWRLEGLRSERLRPTTELVGRVAELSRLREALERAQAGRAQWVGLRGDAGLGKTRLVAELTREALERGFFGVQAHALDFGAATGGGVFEQLARANAWTEVSPSLAMAARELRGELTAEDRAALAELSGERRREAGVAALREMIASQCAHSPVLLVVEDVHWMGSTAVRDLAALADAVSDLPVLAVVTTRPEGELDALASVRWLELGPLQPEHAAALAQCLLGGASTARIDACVARAGGNPLFVEQLAAEMGEGGDRGLPASIRSLVLARTDRLDPRDRAAIDAAAVLGQRFDPAAVRAMLDDPHRALDGLLAHRLLEKAGDELLFHHALIRDGVYSALTRGRRSALHQAAARWFADRDLPLHALHLDRAGDPGAPRACLLAGQSELEAVRFAAAGELFRRGLELATERADRLDLARALGEHGLVCGEGQTAVDAFAEALALEPGRQDRCRFLVGRAAGYRLLSALSAAMEALDLAQPLAEAEGEDRLLAQIHYHRGSLLFADGDAAGSLAAQTLALEIAERLGNPELRARALSGLGDVAFYDGRMEDSRDAFTACLELCEALGLQRYAVPNRVMLGETYLLLNDPVRAVEHWDRAERSAERLGVRYARILLWLQRGVHAIHLGDCARAIDLCRAALAETERLGASRYRVEVETGLAEALARTGDLEGARRVALDSLAHGREAGLAFCGPMVLGLVAWLARDRSAVAEGVALIEAGSMFVNHLSFHSHVLELALAEDDEELLAVHAAALRSIAQPGGMHYWLADRAEALLRWRRGLRDAETRAKLHSAAEGARIAHGDPMLPADAMKWAAKTGAKRGGQNGGSGRKVLDHTGALGGAATTGGRVSAPWRTGVRPCP